MKPIMISSGGNFKFQDQFGNQYYAEISEKKFFTKKETEQDMFISNRWRVFAPVKMEITGSKATITLPFEKMTIRFAVWKQI
jgi:hypothetical protein